MTRPNRPTFHSMHKVANVLNALPGSVQPTARKMLAEIRDAEPLLAFSEFPEHLKTTSPIESTFVTVRVRTKLTKGPGSRGLGGHDRLARAEVVIGIETERGLWVDAPVGTGYVVYAINSMAVARYRQRHSLGGAKSDAADAMVLADLVRTDRHNHRPIAGDTAEAEGIKVLARATRV